METQAQPIVLVKKRRVQNRKYDWNTIRAQFLAGSWTSPAEFLKDKALPTTLIYNPNFVKIVEEKRKKSGNIMVDAAAKDITNDFSDEGKARARHARIGRYMQIRGMEALKDPKLTITSADDARKLIASGIEEERKASGLESQGGKNTFNQVNINVKTNMDRIIEKASYEEILGIIAELKRGATRGATQEATNGSSTEVTEGEVI